MPIDPKARFVQEILGNQRRIFGFILSVVADPNEADDIFQETAVKLWELADEFDPARPFMPWACGVAFNVIRSHRSRRRRDRHVFSDAFMRELADASVENTDWLDARREALADCLLGLNAEHRLIIERCYNGRETIQKVADACGQNREMFYKKLQRIRRALLRCVEQTLNAEGTA